MLANTGRLPSYLTTNGYHFCFKMRVPHDLIKTIGRAEVKFSLKTESVIKARSKALSPAGNYRQMFKWVKDQRGMGTLTEQEIQDVAECFVGFAEESNIWDEINWGDSTSISPEDLRRKIIKTGNAVAEYNHAASTGDYSKVTKVPRTMEYILPIAVENPPAVGSSEFKMLCQRASEAMRDKSGRVTASVTLRG